MVKTPQAIQELVKKFDRNPHYNETQIRVEFVNPFWEALGWDVLNKSGYSLCFRDVLHEDEVRVGRTTPQTNRSTGWCMSCMV